jgi:hypothetical protein
MSWYDSAREHIRRLHDALPEDVAFEDRQKAVSEAYPWGERKYHPYKMWLKAQREYLVRFAPPGHDSKRFPLSPLEKMMRRAQS